MSTIRINEVEYPVRFGLNALRLYCSSRKIDFEQFQREIPEMVNGTISFDSIEKLALLIQSGVKDGIRKEKTKQELPTIEDVIDLFENAEEFAKAMELFASSLPQPKPEEDTEKN
jgi:hypothetical protein